jgi:hypothetical protein
MKKFCIKCGIEKDINLFSKRKISKDGYRNDCKDCCREYKRIWSIENYKENKEVMREKSKIWRQNNPDKVKESNKKSRESIDKEKTKITMKEYRQNNKEKLLLQRKEYLKNNPDMKDKFNKNRYRKMTDIQRLKLCTRNILNKSLKKEGFSKSSKTTEILGCGFEEFKLYLERKFEYWMNWENRGKYNGQFNYGWDIDHIIPLASAETEEDIIILNHYTNLQPLCSKVNRDIKRDIY